MLAWFYGYGLRVDGAAALCPAALLLAVNEGYVVPPLEEHTHPLTGSLDVGVACWFSHWLVGVML
jgi:hypothetical protein